jgi:hypothetical protein
VGGDNSIGQRLRDRRAALLLQRFPDLSERRVLDLGGRAGFWTRIGVTPAEVVSLNPEAEEEEDRPAWYSPVLGDACDPPPEIADDRFDLVFSNSTIEHVGGWERRQAFAATVQRLGRAHFVQTPNRYFPVEPHYLFPGYQFLPLPVRGAILRRWPLVHTGSGDREVALRSALSTELIGRTEFSLLFPDSEIVTERVLGLGKSFVAIGSDEQP